VSLGDWRIVVLVSVALGCTRTEHAPVEASAAAVPAVIAAPPAPSAPARLAGEPLARWKLTEGAVSGAIFRAHSAGTAIPGARILGYLVDARAGESPLLAASLRELVSHLRSPDGFDDTKIRRCMSGVSVGVRIARENATTEMVIDFGCDRLRIAGAAAENADMHVSQIDPSRSAFVHFVRGALPQDPALNALQ
jgi:hypothetical protein